MQPDARSADLHTEFLLHLADNALVLGQRNAEWCGHGPALEEDLAMANIALDLIGQARLIYQHAATRINTFAAAPLRGPLVPGQTLDAASGLAGVTEDSLAYLREASEFRNWVLVELPHRTASVPAAGGERDYAVTIVRNYLFASLMLPYWELLQGSSDPQLAAIAARSVKETRYHVRHATDWMIRLGDGTAQSQRRMQAALDYLLPFTQEFWSASAMEQAAVQAAVAPALGELRASWSAALDTVLVQATLRRSESTGHVPAGKRGLHSEHLSYLLAEMQSLARAHPGATW